MSRPACQSKPRPVSHVKAFLRSAPATTATTADTHRRRGDGKVGSWRDWRVGSAADELDVIPVQSNGVTDQLEGAVAWIDREVDGSGDGGRVGGFVNEGRLSFGGGVGGEFQGFSSSPSSSSVAAEEEEVEDVDRMIDRAINAAIVLAAGSFAVTKLLTIDSDYWHVSVVILLLFSLLLNSL